MKTVLVHLIACMALPSWTVASTVPSVTAPHSEAIAEYVQFLRQPHQTPVDYLLSLFHTYDIVVLCERVHPEITQYDLLYELACDRRFQEQVGHIFTECGSCTLRSFVESFLLDATLTDEQVTEKLRHFYRNYDWGEASSRTNSHQFLRRMHALNRTLPENLRIHLHPSDLAFCWQDMTAESYAEFRKGLGQRDKIMAENIMEKIRELRRSGGRSKALVIMNYRHAFPHLTIERGGKSKTFQNTAGFLMEAAPGRVANVMINAARIMPGSSDNQAVLSAIQDGKWDAAFAVLGNPSLGFNFADSPFGDDAFDYFPFPFPTGHTYPDFADSRVETGVAGSRRAFSAKSLHYMAASFRPRPAVIRGGGWAGSWSFSRVKSSCRSGSGWV